MHKRCVAAPHLRTMKGHRLHHAFKKFQEDQKAFQQKFEHVEEGLPLSFQPPLYNHVIQIKKLIDDY
jgi:hypothetical protein